VLVTRFLYSSAHCQTSLELTSLIFTPLAGSSASEILVSESVRNPELLFVITPGSARAYVYNALPPFFSGSSPPFSNESLPELNYAAFPLELLIHLENDCEVLHPPFPLHMVFVLFLLGPPPDPSLSLRFSFIVHECAIDLLGCGFWQGCDRQLTPRHGGVFSDFTFSLRSHLSPSPLLLNSREIQFFRFFFAAPAGHHLVGTPHEPRPSALHGPTCQDSLPLTSGTPHLRAVCGPGTGFPPPFLLLCPFPVAYRFAETPPNFEFQVRRPFLYRVPRWKRRPFVLPMRRCGAPSYLNQSFSFFFFLVPWTPPLPQQLGCVTSMSDVMVG